MPRHRSPRGPAHRERKSVGAEDTFATDIETTEEARRHLAPLIDKVWAVMTRRELAGRTVTLEIKFANFTQITRSKSRPLPVRSRAEFEELVEALLGPEFSARAASEAAGRDSVWVRA